MTQDIQATPQTTTPIQVSYSDVLDRGLTVFRKLTANELSITRAEAIDLLNFEVAIQTISKGFREVEGKPIEELLKMKLPQPQTEQK